MLPITFDLRKQCLAASFARHYAINTTIADFGAGAGTMIRAIMLYGRPRKVYCYDGNPNVVDVTQGLCRQADLGAPGFVLPHGAADVVYSSEVGEHIPRQYEQNFLDNLARNARQTLFITWAVPEQAGVHANPRHPSYVANELAQRGFVSDRMAARRFREEYTECWHNASKLLRHRVGQKPHYPLTNIVIMQRDGCNRSRPGIMEIARMRKELDRAYSNRSRTANAEIARLRKELNYRIRGSRTANAEIARLREEIRAVRARELQLRQAVAQLKASANSEGEGSSIWQSMLHTVRECGGVLLNPWGHSRCRFRISLSP